MAKAYGLGASILVGMMLVFCLLVLTGPTLTFEADNRETFFGTLKISLALGGLFVIGGIVGGLIQVRQPSPLKKLSLFGFGMAIGALIGLAVCIPLSYRRFFKPVDLSDVQMGKHMFTVLTVEGEVEDSYSNGTDGGFYILRRVTI